VTECPHCGYEAADVPAELAHMTTWHPEVVAERLNAAGERVTAEAIRAAAGPPVPDAVYLTDAERDRVLWWLRRPVPPGPLKDLDERIIRKLAR
jgi:hypothetical protein